MKNKFLKKKRKNDLMIESGDYFLKKEGKKKSNKKIRKKI